jgi:hypothetical protein
MPNKWDDETKAKIAAGAKKSWESGERKAPITSIKEELTDVKGRLTKAELDIERMKRRDARIREVFRRHREVVDKGRKQPEGHPIRSFMDELMEAWDFED